MPCTTQAYGENLTAVWYRKVALADGTASWKTKAFDDQNQSKAFRAVKQALALATCPPRTDPSAMRVPTGPGWAEGGFETLDETDTTHT